MSSDVSQWSYSSSECGGSFSTLNGLLTSPSYPYEYPQNLDCIYNISPPSGSFLKLTVFMFDIPDGNCGSHRSEYDYLEIRDGIFEESPLVGKFCENSIPASILLTQEQARIK